jgi:hypothetical protein
MIEFYIDNYNNFSKTFIYDFNKGMGGIADCIKFFLSALRFCIENNIKLYYKKNNIFIEKYLKLKHSIMYIDDTKLKNAEYLNSEIELENLTSDKHYLFTPCIFYESCKLFKIKNIINININDIFYFSEEVIQNSYKLYVNLPNTYYVIHVRLGDKFLDNLQINNHTDKRKYNEENLINFLSKISEEIFVLFLCDSMKYKNKIKKMFDNIKISNCIISNTSFFETTDEQTLDSVSEFYILTNAEKIYAFSPSGFSDYGAQFNKKPYEVMF